MTSKTKDTLLLVGDGNSGRAELRVIFEDTYYLLEAENTAQAGMLLEQNSGCVAAVLADLPLSAGEELRPLAEASHREKIPVLLFVTPVGTGEREEYAFLLGADDVIYKPYTILSIRRRVQVLVDLYRHQRSLEDLVEKQTAAIRGSNQAMLDTLSAIIEQRSTETGKHILRIRSFTRVLLREVAGAFPEYGLTDLAVDMIASAASLHDIGKISIPDVILNKPGPLSAEEFEVMKGHTAVGGRLVEQMAGMGDAVYLRYAYNIAMYHHERWDGGGYPAGLKGDKIPICAQVVGLADTFDALTSQRVYKPAFSCEKAFDMIAKGACGVFSPRLLECLQRVRQTFEELAHQYADGYSPAMDEIPAPAGPSQYAADAARLDQDEYQALLHYANDTVMELDVDRRRCRVVYNPNLEFETLPVSASFDELAELLLGVEVRGEAGATLWGRFSDALFQQKRRKCAFPCRVISPDRKDGCPYEATLLRVDMEDPDRRVLLAVFHRLPDPAGILPALMGAALLCSPDEALTIEEGAESLALLTGYRSGEVRSVFADSLLKLTASEDRSTLVETMWDAIQYGGKREVEVRLQRKDGEPVWVLVKAQAYGGTEKRLCVSLTDITTCKDLETQLDFAARRAQIVVDQFGGMVYEWDLDRDILICYGEWGRQFGYQPVSDHFSQRLETVARFHPDDLPLMRKEMEDARKGEETVDFDIRLADREGRYYWNRVRAATLYEEDAPNRVVGVLMDVDELKRSALSMKAEAERDPLTKLYNKTTLQRLVTNYLDARTPTERGAVLMLDLDNFKSVNDNYGHMYGDALLVEASAAICKQFRTQDAIGRIGGDEFMILLRDISDRTVLENRCAALVRELRELMRNLMPDLDVSCSVGCALIPEHGSTYDELYQHADEALYRAKTRGKDQYKIYDGQDTYQMLRSASNPRRSTRMDSDEEPTLTDEVFAGIAFQRLYESRDIETAINDLLAFIGARFNVSRAYIFENNEDNTACSCTFEWCNAGISAEKSVLQNMSYSDRLRGWEDLYDRNGMLYCTDITRLDPHFQAILAPLGIKSFLQYAVKEDGVFRGFVGFDECTSNRLWTQGQTALLRFLAAAISVFLLRYRSRERRRLAEEQKGP